MSSNTIISEKLRGIMAFFIHSLASRNQELPKRPEDIAILSRSQMRTGIFDTLFIVGIHTVAALILANNAHYIHLPVLKSFTNRTACILVSTTLAVALIDFITLAVQTCKKFNALLARLKESVSAPGALEKNPIIPPISQGAKPQLQETRIEKSEIVASKVKLEINDSKSNCPCIGDGKLYVSSTQAEQMKTDPYFQKFFSNNFDTIIANGELFLNNLSIFLNPTIYSLYQQVNLLGIFQLQDKIAANTKEFSTLFATLGLSKDAAFVHHNGDLIGTSLQTVLMNLAHAAMMGNQVLVLFWIQALKQFMPFEECIDLFPTILETPLAQPEHLHELLFECLVRNFNKEETQTFLNTYKEKLKIKSLNLGTLLDVAKPHTHGKNKDLFEQNKNKLNKLLNILDLQYIEILNRESSGLSSELEYVLAQCQQIICLRGTGITGRDVASLANVEKTIPIVDLTGYPWRVDGTYFENTSDRVFINKNIQGKHVQFIYLTKDRGIVDKYLKIYHGVTLDQTV